MIQGHGDDRYRFDREIRADFSSNVYAHVDLEPLKAHLRARLDDIGRYPEPEPYSLEKALAKRLGIDPAAVCVTAGATEAIYLIAHAFKGSHSTILAPTFSEYADACRLYAHSVAPVSVLLPKKGRCAENRPPLHSLFWLCNPNNPTGTVIPKEQLVRAIEDNPETIFVIDQSYGFFTQETLLTAKEAIRYPNVIQLHSMTKRYAMPGLRLGYITAHPQLIEKIRSVRMPWSVNALAIAAGLYLTQHPDTARIDLTALLTETQRLRDRLNAIPGLTAEPTQTHFFLCRLEKGRAADLKQRLAEEYGILIRDASNFEGLDEGCFRIATQTPEENDRLVEAIRNILKVNV
ncbi:MAG: pyridoxal phosphate-dependent class II aminotransferase [Bacteroidales bacterium]|nr:pyridoxal phosphate-dependent class II aminotransferase [Bacteroidales bacterium]MBR6424281.1 pyridoxal phosphate-dependent class II aminotransferase [Bacteroidales bacterium]